MFKPLRDYLIIKADKPEEKSKAGVYLAYEWKRLSHYGEVTATGPEVTQVQKGDHVRFNRYAFEKIGEDEFIGIEKNVVAKIDV